MNTLMLQLIPGRLRRAFEGFWTTPLILSALGLSAGAGLDALPAPGFAITDALNAIPPERADAVLSLVAGAVLTVASIVFSLAFVALSAIAGSLSPRMIDFVIRDRAMQLLIGGALGAFLFSGVAILTGAEREAWRQALAAVTSLTWATLVLATVVIFAHRMTRILRPDEMVSSRGDAFVATVRRQTEAPSGCVAADAAAAAALTRAMATGRPLRASRPGYVGSIDHAGLIALAAAHDGALRLDVLPNDYLPPGAQFGAAVAIDRDEDETIEAMLGLTDRREPTGDAVYEAQALSEAALRALSPGINDPATARSCADRLFEGIILCATGDAQPEALTDGRGRARLARRRYGVAEMLDTAAAPILHYGRDDPAIRAHLARLAQALADAARRDEDREAAQRFLSGIDG